jgi:hypothetical protein
MGWLDHVRRVRARAAGDADAEQRHVRRVRRLPSRPFRGPTARRGEPPRWGEGTSRLVSYLAFAAVAVATVAGLVAQPQEMGTTPAAEVVIVAGAVGLRWDDVDPEQTPHLWRLAQTGAIGSLAVRSARQPTCPADGWVTLGAGNWAAGSLEPVAGEQPPPAEPCQPLEVAIEPSQVAGAYLREHQPLVRHNQWGPWGALPGALAGSVGCTVAVGEGAALAGARSYGRVDRYHPSLPSDPDAAARGLGEDCALAIVDLGAVSGTGEPRAAAARRVDALLARVLAARPAGSLVLVAGVADLDGSSHLHVAVADAPGLPAGWLASATTGRNGYLQLVDIAPTVLAALRQPPPELAFVGHPAESRAGRPAGLAEAVTDLAAADQQGQRARPVSTWFLAGLTVLQLGLFAAAVPLLREPGAGVGNAGPAGDGRARGGRPRRGLLGLLRRRIGGDGRGRWRRLARRFGPLLLVGTALAIPAALLSGWLPWWQAEAAAGAVFAAISIGLLAVASLLVVRTPILRSTLGLVAVGAGVAAVAVGVDLATGSWLQLNGVVGYLAHDGGQYAGISDIGLGVLIAGTLLVAGCLAELVARRPRLHGGSWLRPLVVVAVGALGVVLAGSPYLGADIGGAVALTVGVCVAAAMCTGGWVTAGRVAWATGLGLAVLVAVAVVDVGRPVERRTGLGNMLNQLAEGTAALSLRQVSGDNVDAFTTSPLTLLAIGSGAFLWFALMRPWGGLRRLFGIHPALRAGLVGMVVAGLVGGVLVGAALSVAGAAAAVGVPLLTLTSLRARRRSAQQAQRVAARLTPPRHSEVLE